MKTKDFMQSKALFLLGLIFLTTFSCERDYSDAIKIAGFDTTAEIFTDNFIGLGEDFYFPYGDSKFTAFSVDNDEGYQSNASIRIDVPNENDPEGNYAGGIFRIDGAGRDLSGYDALTFWAKASQGVSVGEIGFGEDFFENKYVATITNVSVGTNWTKYVIPIPDPSKLTQEKGMLRYATGTQNTNGNGYTLWIDDLKFEKLGTVAQPRPVIANGNAIEISSFTGVTLPVSDLNMAYNLASGADQIVFPAPKYYQFYSSNMSVATVTELGVIEVLSGGTTVITATLGGVEAEGSITINSLGDFQLAPTPTRNASNVISIYSDAYTSIPVDFFNGYWEPFQTTLSSDFEVDGDHILSYTNFNFVGNQFSSPTVDATTMSNLHINMYIPDNIEADLDFLITIKDFGADQADGGGDDTTQQVFFYAADFTANTWVTLEMPITMANRNNIGQIIYENINNTTTSSIERFYLDNVYFYN
ncbi:MAG: glycosyl hydrolase family 16 [Winogradskyella sp.]